MLCSVFFSLKIVVRAFSVIEAGVCVCAISPIQDLKTLNIHILVVVVVWFAADPNAHDWKLTKRLHKK